MAPGIQHKTLQRFLLLSAFVCSSAFYSGTKVIKQRKKNYKGKVSKRASLRRNRALQQWVSLVCSWGKKKSKLLFALWDAFRQKFAWIVFDSEWLGTSATFSTFTGWFYAHFWDEDRFKWKKNPTILDGHNAAFNQENCTREHVIPSDGMIFKQAGF